MRHGMSTTLPASVVAEQDNCNGDALHDAPILPLRRGRGNGGAVARMMAARELQGHLAAERFAPLALRTGSRRTPHSNDAVGRQ